MATETRNRNHSAVFPEELPAWFIKLFTQEGDLVLDPFMGSGTTLQAAYRLRRNAIGTELKEEYFQVARARLDEIMLSRQPLLLEGKETYEASSSERNLRPRWLD